jgi:hypothetical protein
MSFMTIAGVTGDSGGSVRATPTGGQASKKKEDRGILHRSPVRQALKNKILTARSEYQDIAVSGSTMAGKHFVEIDGKRLKENAKKPCVFYKSAFKL